MTITALNGFATTVFAIFIERKTLGTLEDYCVLFYPYRLPSHLFIWFMIKLIFNYC